MALAKEALGHSSEPSRDNTYMSKGELNWLANFIWRIAGDVLRDLYVRGKYRDVILPMTVLRRLDAVLEPTKQAVLDMKATLDKAGITSQDLALRQAAGQAFYNTSKFTLRDLKARSSQQQLRADFEAYLDGFSPNVQDILDNFEFRNQIPRLSKGDRPGDAHRKVPRSRGQRKSHAHLQQRWIAEAARPRQLSVVRMNGTGEAAISWRLWLILADAKRLGTDGPSVAFGSSGL